jgi:hypothetical protein
MNRKDYLKQVIEIYLDSPDTPHKARRCDWALAGALLSEGVPLSTVAHAVRFVTLNRWRRDPKLEPLEPIRSLAYFRPFLRESPHDPGFVEYVQWSYEHNLDGTFRETSIYREAKPAAKPPSAGQMWLNFGEF